jgi:hypothetical protein
MGDCRVIPRERTSSDGWIGETVGISLIRYNFYIRTTPHAVCPYEISSNQKWSMIKENPRQAVGYVMNSMPAGHTPSGQDLPEQAFVLDTVVVTGLDFDCGTHSKL